MRFNQLDQWLSWLEQLHPKAIDLGLDRVRKVALSLDLIEQPATVITVAGTNGKGSTIAALNALLSQPHKKNQNPLVGVFTSPHLQRFNERIVIAGEEVSDEQLCQAFNQIDIARSAVKGSSDDELTLSYFEFATLAALMLFKQARLDYVLLEVGLGGRLDSVNIVSPDVAVITRIGIDHEEWLGTTREKIALEKAGILRQGITAVIADTSPPQTLVEKIFELDCNVIWASPLGDVFESNSENTPNPLLNMTLNNSHRLFHDQGKWVWKGFINKGDNGSTTYVINDLVEPAIHQHSWSAALQAVLALDVLPNISPIPATIVRLMNETQPKGRQSMVCFGGRNIILDVAHNNDSVEYLARKLSSFVNEASEDVKTIVIFAVMADKPVVNMLLQLFGLVDHWVFPQLCNNNRALDAESVYRSLQIVSEEWQKANGQRSDGSQSIAKITHNVASAVDWAIQHSSTKDRIVILGSFYTVGAAFDYFDAQCVQGSA